MIPQFQEGDWVEMVYGYERRQFYVLWAGECGLRIGLSEWLITSAEYMTYEELYSEHHESIVYLGRGKKKRWARWFKIRRHGFFDCFLGAPFTYPAFGPKA